MEIYNRFTDNDGYCNAYITCASTSKAAMAIDDVIIGAKSAEQEANFKFKLHKKSVIDTGGLPYHITFVVGKHYVITTNIDVTDGLCNGAVGKLVHLEFDESNTLITVWLEFCGSDKVGRKKRQKAAALAVQNRVGNLAVPIELRTANISLTSDRKCIAKRKHFPLTSALALTIHKSQGGTFDEIVYEYSKAHSQELVYVALSQHLLIDLVRERVSVIENKNTDTNTNSKKLAAWADLLCSFNSMCKGGTRTLPQIKSQWSIIKMTKKKIKSVERKNLRQTGGGPHPTTNPENADDIC
ncbi:unnamed protein product [Parnassius apollo]|uniref:Regulatory protein zeste n=1 Tax=Parnassius apollo TaxID=110799 RepID=A0A8S3XV69_PARAO|nr:unnamed protein product [Parnassius apollo]